MILTRFFVFIHVPRTAGTFVRQVFQRAAPDHWETQILEGHPSVREIPESRKSLPRIAVVRNPFDWYVSWYQYMRQIGGNPIFDAASARGTGDFRSTILSLLSLPVRSFFPEDEGQVLSFSWYLGYLLDRDFDAVQMVRFEQLRAQLTGAFGSVTSLPEKLASELACAPPANTSDRGAYSHYYDCELRSAVERADRFLLERFLYSF